MSEVRSNGLLKCSNLFIQLRVFKSRIVSLMKLRLIIVHLKHLDCLRQN